MPQNRTVVNGITEGVIWKQLLLFFFPILLGSFFQQMYNTVDAMIVGRFAGKLALAAVGSTGAFVSMLFGFFVGVASGATVILSQFYGARDWKGVHGAVHTGVALALLAGVLVTALGLILAVPVLRLMRVPEDTYAGALTYIRTFFSGMIACTVYNVGAGILRALGDSRRPLYFLIVSCVTNIVLDLLFVAVFHWGVFGAAFATVISQAVSAVLVVLCLMRREDASCLVLKEIRVEMSIFRDILHIGIPAGMQSVMYSVSNMIIQTSINSFGSDTVAAWTALGRMDSVVWLVMGAFGTAITTFVGQNFGAQRYDRMRRSTRICLVMALGATLTLSALILTFGRNLIGLFTTDPAVIDLGAMMVRRISPFYTAYVAVEVLSGTIRGTGDSVRPVIFIACGTCLLRIVWVAVCMRLGLGFEAVILTYAVSWSVTSVIFIVYYLRGNWLKRRIAAMGYVPEKRAA